MHPEPTVYLDHAAATPVADSVLTAMQVYFQDKFYNPSATYLPAKAVRTDLSEARQQVAECLGARSSEIIFTAGGSEANNLAIQGVMSAYPDGEVLTSAIEHDSVLETVRRYDHRIVSVDQHGLVSVEELVKQISDRTVLVSVMYANNEIGSVQPIRQLAAAIADIRSARHTAGNDLPLVLHTDAAQAPNYLDIHVSRLGIDLMTLNGGKIYGPKQSGVLYVRAGVQLEPLIHGGGQERGLRSGTENVAGAIGFAAALAETTARRHNESARLQAIRQTFVREVTEQLPAAQFLGSPKKSLPNIISMHFPGVDNERLLLQLERAGILAAAGSACSASNDDPSHVLAAIGLSEAEARGTVRFSMGRATSAADMQRVAQTLVRLLA
jgi:cysteine desulfurase